MTQKYYCDRLLPLYIKAVEEAQLRGTERDDLEEIGEVDWLLLEDNDGPHGHGRASKKNPWNKPDPYYYPRPGLATNLKADS